MREGQLMSDNENTNVPTHEDPDTEPTVAMTPIADSMPASIPPETNPTTDVDPVKKPRPKWLIPSIAAGCVIVLIIGGVVAWRTMDAKHQLEAAKASCESGLATVNSAKTAWEKKLQDQTVTTASKITKDKVADPKVITTLSDLTGTEYTKIINCNATDPAGYEKITEANQQLQSKYEDNANALMKAVNAVNDSVTVKQVNDAKASLKKTIDSAKKLLTDSKNKVADNKTRDTLSKAIDAASKNGKTVDEINKLNKTLTDAINAVNASIQKKKDEDAAAKAKAEQEAQAEAAAQSQSQSQTSNGYSSNQSYGYDNNYSYTNQNNGNTGSQGQGSQNTYTPPVTNNNTNGNNNSNQNSNNSGSEDEWITACDGSYADGMCPDWYQ